jgi:endonuclease YncB( thermonuclease family)
MNNHRWRSFAADHVGTLRLGLLLVIATALLVWRPYPPATEMSPQSSVVAGFPRVYRPTAATPRIAAGLVGPIAGYPRVVDGDTIDISGTRIRLHGIDAPEATQTCTIGGQRYQCGARSTMALADFIRGHMVRCIPVGLDQYRRTIARCHTEEGNIDINAWLVRQGLAVAYRRYSVEYLADELRAHMAGRGLWAGSFQMPRDYRAEGAGETMRQSQ